MKESFGLEVDGLSDGGLVEAVWAAMAESARKRSLALADEMRDDIVSGAKLLAAPDVKPTCRAEVTALWRPEEDLASFFTHQRAAGFPLWEPGQRRDAGWPQVWTDDGR